MTYTSYSALYWYLVRVSIFVRPLPLFLLLPVRIYQDEDDPSSARVYATLSWHRFQNSAWWWELRSQQQEWEERPHHLQEYYQRLSSPPPRQYQSSLWLLLGHRSNFILDVTSCLAADRCHDFCFYLFVSIGMKHILHLLEFTQPRHSIISRFLHGNRESKNRNRCRRNGQRRRMCSS